MKKTILFCAITSLLGLQLTASDVHAIKLKIKQSANSDNRVVVASSSEAVVTDSASDSVKLSGKTAQLALLSDSGPQSVILAYKKGKKVLPAKKVLSNPDKFCADGNIQAYTGLKTKKATLKINTRSEGDVAFYSGKLKGKKGLKRKSLTGLVSVGTDCLPSGNGLTLGLASASSSQARLMAATEDKAMETDQDKDGMLDLFDVDIDNDSILNNYDKSSSLPSLFPTFKIFSNLKVGLESTVNVNALGRSPTKEEVDQLTSGTTLAIQVKATGSEESELNCKGLSYCSAGGTGTTGNPATSFPGAAGGTHDSDSDGHGTITAGGTGDFQLSTNLSAFNEANAGDSFVQTVSSSGSALAKQYFASLQFVFRATPAVKTLTLDPDGTATATNFSYPITNGDAGTPANCLSVTPNTDGDIIFEYQAWRPQRAGVKALGEADFVDLGNSNITIDIPNAPAAGGTAGGGPGNCPTSTYSTTDSNLSISGDTLQDSMGDKDADAANLVTFRVNVTDCLASVGETLDSGEQVSLDLQFRNSVGDNSAQILCIERP